MNDPWQKLSPYWLQTAAPFGFDLGLPALPSSPDQWPASISAPSAPPIPSTPLPGGLLGDMNRRQDQSLLWHLSRDQDSPPASPTDGGPPGSPYWPQTAMPFDMGLRPPDLPAPWPRSTLPIPAAPPTFPSALPPSSWDPGSPSLWHPPFGANAGFPPQPISDDPFARAAFRTRQSVQPDGGRLEGAATTVLENYLPHVANQLQTLPQRAFEASERHRLTGQYDPGPAVETALMMVGSPLTPLGALGSSARRPPRLPMDEASRISRADAMGMRRRMPVYGAVAPEGEQIAAAAVKVGDRVFTGPSHAVAIKKAEATFDAPFETLPLAPIPDGFVTTGGRFVSRHEAADIAAATRQARPVGPTGLPAWQGLASERLRPGNPNAATSGVSTGATAPGLPGGEGAAWLSLEPGAGTTTLWHRAANPVRVDVQGATLPEIHATLAEAWSRGHDSVMLKNYMRPGATKPEDIIVVRERAQLRDPRARFDPAKRNSDDLSASIAALLGPSVAVQVGGRASPQTSEDAFWDAWRRGDAL